MTLHLTKKNAWIWLSGVCGVLLVVIGLLVPSEQWGLPPWKWIIFALLILVLMGITVQLFVQSREDQEREAKEAVRDKTQETILIQLSQLSEASVKTTDRSVLSALSATQQVQPLNPPVDFNAEIYFRTAYHSQWTADVEKRIKIAAAQNATHYTPEEFYSKFIGVGLVSYMHEMTWAYIWKSQILMLAELNKAGGIMPVANAKAFYDAGKAEAPGFYTNYSFDQWLSFMQSAGATIRHASEMLEITVRGRDFLSYCAHYSHRADQRRG